MSKGHQLLTEWIAINHETALGLAHRLEHAAEEHPLITATRRPPVTQVRRWLEIGARPWHQYRVLLEIVTDSYVPVASWTEAT